MQNQASSDPLLSDARNYLVDFLQGKQLCFEARHPWRKDWEFAVFHSLRVERYALKILKREAHCLPETEIQLLRLAAILHDIARLEITENHARLGAEIAHQWLSNYQQNRLGNAQRDRVVEMIAGHSDKAYQENDFSKAVLKDADTLDEIGAISIFMSGNWIDRESSFFFHDLSHRLKDFEIPFCEEKDAILNTNGARAILQEKKQFIEAFILQLDGELESDDQIDRMLKDFRVSERAV